MGPELFGAFVGATLDICTPTTNEIHFLFLLET